jgi:hypothetical protein
MRHAIQRKEIDVPEVCLLGRLAGHGFVVSVEMGVVVDLQGRGVQGRRDLFHHLVANFKEKTTISGIKGVL